MTALRRTGRAPWKHPGRRLNRPERGTSPVQCRDYHNDLKAHQPGAGHTPPSTSNRNELAGAPPVPASVASLAWQVLLLRAKHLFVAAMACLGSRNGSFKKAADSARGRQRLTRTGRVAAHQPALEPFEDGLGAFEVHLGNDVALA